MNPLFINLERNLLNLNQLHASGILFNMYFLYVNKLKRIHKYCIRSQIIYIYTHMYDTLLIYRH